MRNRAVVGLVVLLAAVGGPGERAWAETLVDCLNLGRANGRTAKLLLAEKTRQRAQLGLDRADFRPKLAVTRDTNGQQSTRVSDRLASRTQVSASLFEDGEGDRSEQVTLSQSVFVHSAVELSRARIRWRIAQVEFDQGMEDYKFAIVRKFFDVLRSQERIKTLIDSVERWNRSLTFAEVKFNLGVTNKIDMLNTRVNQGNAQTALLSEQQSLARLTDELRDLIGVPLTRPLTAVESLDFQQVETGVVQLERREVKVARLRQELAKVNLNDARQRAMPDLRVDTTYRSSQNAPILVDNLVLRTGADEVVTALTYNFQLGKRGDEYDRDRIAQELRQADLKLDEQQVLVAQEHRDILRTLELKERAIRTAKESLDQARESYDFSLDAFQKGMISSLDLRDSQDKLTQARDSYASLVIDYKIARYQYVKVLGGTL